MEMHCTNCGTKLEPGAQFCSNCGTPVAGSAVPGAPPRKSRRGLWIKILAGVAVFIVAVVALALYLTADLIEPIDRQIAALRAGDLDAAYAETSIAFQEATSKEKFADFIKANRGLTQIADHSFSERSYENNIGKVSGTLTTKDGAVIPITYRLVKENGQWRILGFNVGGRE
jgi:hypothetical protein